jgi:hypothetical protein
MTIEIASNSIAGTQNELIRINYLGRTILEAGLLLCGVSISLEQQHKLFKQDHI